MVETQGASCDDGTPGTNTFTYHWNAVDGTEGTWPYHDHTFLSENGGEALGLFGTVIVNPDKPGLVKALVFGDVRAVKVENIKKEYILWMTSTEVYLARVYSTGWRLIMNRKLKAYLVSRPPYGLTQH